MKKRILFVVLLLIAAGCEKDQQDLIVGTWALIDYTVIDNNTGEEVLGGTDVETWTFNNAGSAYVNGSTPMTYTIEEKHLTITYVSSGTRIRYDIEELTHSTLKVHWFVPSGQYGFDDWYTFTRMKE